MTIATINATNITNTNYTTNYSILSIVLMGNTNTIQLNIIINIIITSRVIIINNNILIGFVAIIVLLIVVTILQI